MSASFFICEDCKIDVYGDACLRRRAFLKKSSAKNFAEKGAHTRKLGFFCKQKNALTVASVF